MEYIACVFVRDRGMPTGGSPIPGVKTYSQDDALAYIERFLNLGISNFLVFGIPDVKDVFAVRTENSAASNLISAAKASFGSDVTLVADVGLSPYSADGHSVVMTDEQIDASSSYEAVAHLAREFASAGADWLAPCLSLPDQVQAVNSAAPESRVMPYSVKFSSSMYGPYRATVGSALGRQRKAYQTDFDDPQAAFDQLQRDIDQGAEAVIVKPSLMYLDVLKSVVERCDVPVAAYNVSGEVSLLRGTANSQDLNEAEVFDEFHSALERCGADYVIGYAPEHFVRRTTARNG